jgi:hypothetical protein
VEDSDLNRIEICGALGSTVEDQPSSFRPRLSRTRISIRLRSVEDSDRLWRISPQASGHDCGGLGSQSGLHGGCGGSALNLQATTVAPQSQSTAALGGPPGREPRWRDAPMTSLTSFSQWPVSRKSRVQMCCSVWVSGLQDHLWSLLHREPGRDPQPSTLFSAREFALSSARDVVRTSLMKPKISIGRDRSPSAGIRNPAP